MCRILAIAGKINHQESALILEEFQRLAEFGKVPGASNGHKDGWGIVAYSKGKPFLYARNYKDAFKDQKYSVAVEGLKNKKLDIIIGHLRKASVGSKNTENSHPFVRGAFSFCQNGTVMDSQKIPLKTKFKKIVKGNSDSERLFVYILQRLNEKKKTNTETIGETIKESAEYIQKNFDYTAMNMVFSDGKQIWALREVNEKNSFVKKYKLISYYSLFIGRGDGFSIICSEKLPLKTLQWKAIKNHEISRILAKNTSKKKPDSFCNSCQSCNSLIIWFQLRRKQSTNGKGRYRDLRDSALFVFQMGYFPVKQP
jgi:glutamine amidotransferase